MIKQAIPTSVAVIEAVIVSTIPVNRAIANTLIVTIVENNIVISPFLLFVVFVYLNYYVAHSLY